MTNFFSPVSGRQSSVDAFSFSPFGDKGNSGSGFGSFSSVGSGMFDSLQQILMLAMVIQLLEGISNPDGSGDSQNTGAGSNNGEAQTGTPTPAGNSGAATPTPVTAPAPAAPVHLAMDAQQQQVLNSSFARDNDGLRLPGHSVVIADKGAQPDGQLGVGDVVNVLNANGEVVSSSTLQSGDVYDFEFRVNQVKNAEAVGTGWKFSEALVEIKDGKLAEPELRFYSPNTGGFGIETVVERNELWEVVERDSARYLVMRTHDDAGNPVKASDAINDVFENRDKYAFDCASPIPLFNLKSTLDTIGADDFNANAGQLQVSGWFDAYDRSSGDGGYISTVREAEAGTVTVAGVSNESGETAEFDVAQGDQLVAGGIYYFDLPGDTSTAYQGWNAIYLGQNDTGDHRFWSSSIGEVTASFENGNWKATGELEKYYLGAAISDTNVSRLENWDTDKSVLA